jgi:hypothetical protein
MPDHTVLTGFVTNLTNLEGNKFVRYMDENFEVDK